DREEQQDEVDLPLLLDLPAEMLDPCLRNLPLLHGRVQDRARRGTDLGGGGPMNPTNRNADPTHRTPATMCRRRNTIMNRFAASIRFPSSTGARSAERYADRRAKPTSGPV